MGQLASKEVVDHILSHHGTKGMKWGVRRRISEARAAGKVTRGDKAYVKRASSIANHIDIHNEAADRSNKHDVERINNKPKWKAESEKGTFRNEDHPITQAYYKEHQDAYLGRVKDVVNEIGANTSGTKTLAVHEDPNSLFGWNLHLADVKHGIDNLDAVKPDVVSVKPKIAKDEEGRIIKIHPMGTVEHGELLVGDILAHHGVRGMKWGVRRGGGSKVSPSEVSVKTRSHEQIKTVIRTKGGKGLPAHPDAIAARVIQQKLSKSGTHALSNSELLSLNNRLNLEAQTQRLTPEHGITKGIKFVQGYLKTPQGQQAVKGLTEVASKKAASSFAKKAAAAGVAAAL